MTTKSHADNGLVSVHMSLSVWPTVFVSFNRWRHHNGFRLCIMFL